MISGKDSDQAGHAVDFIDSIDLKPTPALMRSGCPATLNGKVARGTTILERR